MVDFFLTLWFNQDVITITTKEEKKMTEFGNFCRKLRIDRGEILAEMAQKLGVSASFLSTVERGKKSIPKRWLENLSILYHLSTSESQELSQAISNSANVISFDMKNINNTQRDFLTILARKFDEIDEPSLIKWQKQLTKFNKED